MAPNPYSPIEFLESRRLLSGGAAVAASGLGALSALHAPQKPAVAPIKTVNGPTLHLTASVSFSGEVGFYASPVLDPPDAYSASINWGDGTATPATLSYGTDGKAFGYIVSGQHTYAKAGKFTLTATLSVGPINPISGRPTRTVEYIVDQVFVAPPINTSDGGVTITETAGATFTADVGTFITIAPADGISASITWGDGGSSTGVLAPVKIIGIDQIKFKVIGTHTYAEAGRYPIRIVVIRRPIVVPGQPSPDFILIVATIDSTAIVKPDNDGISLAGTITGSYRIPMTTPDVGRSYDFAGAGRAGDLGDVKASGEVRLPGFIASGRAQGTLTLSNANGSLALKLTGPVEGGFGMFPKTLSYVITGGTGAYAADTGSGTIDVTLIDSSTPVAGLGHFRFVIK